MCATACLPRQVHNNVNVTTCTTVKLHTVPWTLLQQAPQSHVCPRTRIRTLCSATEKLGFHQQRLAAEVLNEQDRQAPLTVSVRQAETLAEFKAIGWLRAKSFYAYPAERAFAGEIHQAMIAEEEYKALTNEYQKRQQPSFCCSAERSVCLLAASTPLSQHHGAIQSQPHDSSSKLSSQESRQHNALDVLGTLDLYAVQALHGEVLIGDSDNAAYLANVCVADHARRRGVGSALIHAARSQARQWGVAALYVHIMAVNAAAARFYMLQGFTCEQEESSNQAHYRGHCLDGIEGRGRTMLLRDTLL